MHATQSAEPALTNATIEAIVAQTVAAMKDVAASQDQGGFDMPSAWVFQRNEQVEELGTDAAPWYVGYYDPDGSRRKKSCGAGKEGRRNAMQFKKQVEAQLLLGTFEANCNKTWAEFRERYEQQILPAKAKRTRDQVKLSLDSFERLVSPRKVASIKTQTMDAFISARSQEPRRYRRTEEEPSRPRSKPYADTGTVSVASVNADLRNIKAALRVACDWGFLKELPRFRMLREPKKLPVYVLPEHFALIYVACEQARLPDCQGFTAADWWRALLVTCYQATGWRIGQFLGLQRDDLDLSAGTAIIRAVSEGNKAKQDRLVKLHPVAVEHLRKLAGFTHEVFPWPHNRRTLLSELHRICRAAKVPEYGFHSFRKAFGSMNASRLSATELQHLMQHASIQTTQRFYVNPLAAQDDAVGKLYVPDVLKERKTG